MRDEPIQLQFILPEHASDGTRRHFHCLKKMLLRSHAVHLHLTGLRKENSGLMAQITFSPEDNPPKPSLSRIELSDEKEIRLAMQSLLENPLARSLRPAQQIQAVMESLSKPVKLQVFSAICYEMLHLSPETTRGTLNKKRSLYISPRHGIWCTAELGKRMGWQDCR